jgi:hypothetical protein
LSQSRRAARLHGVPVRWTTTWSNSMYSKNSSSEFANLRYCFGRYKVLCSRTLSPSSRQGKFGSLLSFTLISLVELTFNRVLPPWSFPSFCIGRYCRFTSFFHLPHLWIRVLQVSMSSSTAPTSAGKQSTTMVGTTNQIKLDKQAAAKMHRRSRTGMF